MDVLVGFVRYVLIGILAIFIIVRIVKAASRTVDGEQRRSAALRQAQKGIIFCVRCGKQVGDMDALCTHCGSNLHVPTQDLLPARPAGTPAGHISIPPVVVPTVKEVKLGMTPAEVEAELGLPETKADLGEKILYKHKNTTVEFHDGEVTDVK
jgi:DNA-directed RNA polymerase subunit RPC12/RpoP